MLKSNLGNTTEHLSMNSNFQFHLFLIFALARQVHIFALNYEHIIKPNKQPIRVCHYKDGQNGPGISSKRSRRN